MVLLDTVMNKLNGLFNLLDDENFHPKLIKLSGCFLNFFNMFQKPCCWPSAQGRALNRKPQQTRLNWAFTILTFINRWLQSKKHSIQSPTFTQRNNWYLTVRSMTSKKAFCLMGAQFDDSTDSKLKKKTKWPKVHKPPATLINPDMEKWFDSMWHNRLVQGWNTRAYLVGCSQISVFCTYGKHSYQCNNLSENWKILPDNNTKGNNYTQWDRSPVKLRHNLHVVVWVWVFFCKKMLLWSILHS